ncbi:hypothetical protein H2O64_22425 [Kordia sp. YSTF-M3]|uniref:DUF4840 domain-containing protein n=1 Tax=Kordia aestuariivivens TaxID=2759037 RepID=A0ABR7QG30_9FLAO|nr:hypothetical protein [Kordia aestuariivivens]MBC8757443.1 hypothetical protein [Kordia aestuariivivens]
MRTKIFKLIAFITIAQLCLYACCGDDFNAFMTSFEFTANDEDDEDASSVTNEDFSLIIRPDYQVEMASLLSKKAGFMNMANATTCDENYMVVKNATSVELRADVPLFGIAAGELLNERVLTKYLYSNNESFPLNEIILELNSDNNIGSQYELRFDMDIPVDTTVNFTFTITFENGDEIERTSAAVTFE